MGAGRSVTPTAAERRARPAGVAVAAGRSRGAPGRHRAVERYSHEGLHFELDDLGEPGGEPVVLLHGFPQDRSAWSAVAPQLVSAGYRVLAPDQRGYSPGARPLERRAYRLAALARDVVALADAAGAGRFHVVGHDWGALVAWRLAATTFSRVASLAALSVPHPRAMAAAVTRPEQALRSWYVAAFQLPGVERAFAAAGAGALAAGLRRSGLGPDEASRYAARLADPAAARGALAWYRALPLSSLSSTPAVSVPTLQIWGRRDPFVSRAAADASAEWVTGPLRTLTLEAGHWLPERHAGEVGAALVDHLRSAGGAS